MCRVCMYVIWVHARYFCFVCMFVVHACVFVCVLLCIYVSCDSVFCISVYVYMYVCLRVGLYFVVRMAVLVVCVSNIGLHVCMYGWLVVRCLNMHIHVSVGLRVLSGCLYGYVCNIVFMYKCLFCIYVCIYVCLFLWLRRRQYVCMCVYVCMSVNIINCCPGCM